LLTSDCVGGFFTESIWLLNEIQELEITLGERYNCLPAQLAWVNGNLYTKTVQTAGIIQIPKYVREPVKIQPFNQETDSNQKQAYLAKMQGTRKPVLPVHTIAEKQLFAELMRTSKTFQKCSTSISLPAAEIWNQRAESTADIYYKLEEQLTAYLNGLYKDSANIRQSCTQARGQTESVHVDLQDPQRAKKIVTTSTGPLVPHRVTTGFDQSINSAADAEANPSSVQCLPLYPPREPNSLQKHNKFQWLLQNPPSKLAKSVQLMYWYKRTNHCRDCGKRSDQECAGRSSKRPQVRSASEMQCETESIRVQKDRTEIEAVMNSRDSLRRNEAEPFVTETRDREKRVNEMGSNCKSNWNKDVKYNVKEELNNEDERLLNCTDPLKFDNHGCVPLQQVWKVVNGSRPWRYSPTSKSQAKSSPMIIYHLSSGALLENNSCKEPVLQCDHYCAENFVQNSMILKLGAEIGKEVILRRLGQRDFAAAVLLPHAAAAAAALQRQSAAVVLAADVELLGIAAISGFKGVGGLYCN
ncbi:hypothetical protein B0H14DRAFT_2567726, partial [Mycena olivaceomarginata]